MSFLSIAVGIEALETAQFTKLVENCLLLGHPSKDGYWDCTIGEAVDGSPTNTFID